jgi:hypothetical protein
MAVGERSFGQFSAFLNTMLLLSSNHLCDGGLLLAFMDRRHMKRFSGQSHDVLLWALLPEAAFICNRLDRTRQRDKPLRRANP